MINGKHSFINKSSDFLIEESLNGTISFFKLLEKLETEKNINYFNEVSGISKSFIESAIVDLFNFLNSNGFNIELKGNGIEKYKELISIFFIYKFKIIDLIKKGQNEIIEAIRVLSVQTKKILKYYFGKEEINSLIGNTKGKIEYLNI